MIVEARRDVIVLRGSLAQNEWPTIQAAAKVLLEEHPNGIIIDCSHLTESTPEGAITFRDAVSYIQKHDAKIIVAGLPNSALAVIRGVRAVMSQLPIAATVDDARASLDLGEPAATPSGKRVQIIAVLLIGNWERAMKIACQMADRKRNEVHMVDLLKVSRTIPLATPLPEAEAAARRKLEDAERAVKPYKINTVRHVERVRTVAEGVQRTLSTLQPQTLVVCVGHQNEEAHEIMSEVMPGLLDEPPCEIIYCRLPE